MKVGPWLLGAVTLSLPSLAAYSVLAAERVDYQKQVKPLLQRYCYSCHGALKQESGLRFDTAAAMRKSGVLKPGKGAASALVARVAHADPALRMPPDGPPLKPEEIGLLRAWIDQGATAPKGEQPEADPRKHWSFQRLSRPAIPKIKNAAWRGNPIDAFVAAEHEQRGLTPAPPASRAALLRRVYLDLTGLPPTREELHAFHADGSPNAYEKVVDRLLASPRYGERWGRHWMDVWRYSDWYGRRAQNDVRNSYGQIWRWRDWIVNSLNADKGYDRMVTEMLAADEVRPEDDAAVVATGFIVRNWYSLNYNQWMRDNVEHTSKAFLGLTLNCAHCHDHKYDPITQKDYFAFRAFFEPLELRHDRWPGEPDPGPFKKYIYGGSTAVLKSGMIRVFDEKLDAKTQLYHAGDERNQAQGEPPIAPAAPAFLGGTRLKIEPVALPAAAVYPGVKPFVQAEEIARREQALGAARSAAAADPLRVAVAEAELAAVRARIAADNAKYGRGPGDPAELARAASRAERVHALRAAEARLAAAEAAVADAKAKAQASPGAPTEQAVKTAEQQAATARAAVETAAKAAEAEDTKYTPLSPAYPAQSTGRRRALAQWMTSRDNPLTARVAVNHIWMRHFGRPLVDSVFDFGRNGKRPSHPELLDWLAVDLMESGWSMKRLHRLIVTSNAYRLSSSPGAPSAANNARDGENRFLWRFNTRRVEAEVVRDSLLHAAGTLDLTMGGPELDNGQEATRRRSLYYSVFAEDGGAMRFLATFDAPDTCDAYRRTDSIIPQQALALVNGPMAREQARALAGKLWAEASKAADAEGALITAAFEQLLTRRPSRAEGDACREFLQKQVAVYEGSTPKIADPKLRAAESLVHSLFSHNEFVTTP